MSKIDFDYNGKHYTLEYTRDSIRTMEASGFNPSDIAEKPLLRLEQLWAGAFLANHRRVSNTVIKELFDEMDDLDTLRETLMNMMAETYESLAPKKDESSVGKVKWTVTQ